MKTNSVSSPSDVVRLSSSQIETNSKECSSTNSEDIEIDSFEDESSVSDTSVKYRNVFKDAKALWDTPLEDIEPVPFDVPKAKAIAKEQNFRADPTTKGFFSLVKSFDKTMLTVGHQRYRYIDDIAIRTSKTLDALDLVVPTKERRLEYWHQKQQIRYQYNEAREHLKAERRRIKIEEKGLGFGGRMTSKVAKSKAAAFYAKNNLTIRGNVFKLTHKMVPKNVYEIMPRYGYRKGAHIGVRVTQFALTSILTGLGYALMPVTFGISKIVADHTRTLITLSGEVITHKIAGASNHKCMVHAGLRGVQLEIPRLVPIAGDIVNIGEGIAFGTAAAGIVSTTLADIVLSHFSERYTSTLNIDDLGDSRCISELNSRIDYLSQFLLPYGQYLLLKESDMHARKKLKKVLKENFSLLRDLEKKKVNSLIYYRLALAAEKIPSSHRDKIRRDCEAALPDVRLNTHRVVKRCLAALIANDKSLKESLDNEDALKDKKVEPFPLMGTQHV